MRAGSRDSWNIRCIISVGSVVNDGPSWQDAVVVEDAAAAVVVLPLLTRWHFLLIDSISSLVPSEFLLVPTMARAEFPGQLLLRS